MCGRDCSCTILTPLSSGQDALHYRHGSHPDCPWACRAGLPVSKMSRLLMPWLHLASSSCEQRTCAVSVHDVLRHST